MDPATMALLAKAGLFLFQNNKEIAGGVDAIRKATSGNHEEIYGLAVAPPASNWHLLCGWQSDKGTCKVARIKLTDFFADYI